MSDAYSVYTQKVEEGNIVETARNLSRPDIRYEYDLTKPNISDIKAFDGKESRNLPVKMILNPEPPKGQISETRTYTYQYVYDEGGHVKRKLAFVQSKGLAITIETLRLEHVLDYTYQ